MNFSNTFAATALSLLIVAIQARAEEKVDFTKDIKPILEKSCLKCDGPEMPKGELRLHTKETALRGGDNGQAIVPGNAEDRATATGSGKFRVIRRVRVNPPDSRRHCAFPAARRLADGRILVVYCDSVDHQGTPGGRLMLSESRDQGSTWSKARELLGGLPWHYSTTRPMWQRNDGTLVLDVWSWRKKKEGEAPSWLHLKDRVIETFELGSRDDGKTWRRLGPLPSAVDIFWHRESWCYGEVRKLADGTLIRACYGPDAATGGQAWSVVCLRSQDGGTTWSAHRIVDGRKHGRRTNETELLPLPDGRILAVVRDPQSGTDAFRLYSDDGGKTWGNQSKLGFYMDCPCLHLGGDNRILLFCRSKDTQGGGFFAALSKDFGETWSVPQRLLPGAWDSGYPSAFELPDGKLLVLAYEQTGPSSAEVVALTIEIPRIE